MKTATRQLEAEPNVAYARDSVIRFNEGLIGFGECKDFLLMVNDEIAPLQLLQFAGSTDINFLVMDPQIRIPNYYSQIPLREWEAVGITSPEKRLAFVIVNIGLNPKECTGNFQAPILVNYETMTARQIILTDSGFCLRQSLV